MAWEILAFAVEKLCDVLSQEYAQFQGVEDQVTTVKCDLNMLKSFLKNAYAKKLTDEVVKDCIKEINEIVFDAEDTIETFLIKDELGKCVDIKKCIRRFACILPGRRNIASDLRGIHERISKVIDIMDKFGVQRAVSDARDSQPVPERLEFSRENESNLVGLEENVKQLVGYLVEENDFQVVSMTGMGGLGKTTLARQAFNHEMVKSKFDRLVWVCVSQDCDRTKVWRTILQALRPEDEKKISKMTESTLLGELFGLLETFKSLIVFDDIWEEKHWRQIKNIFPWKKGSKVLLTSRNERIAGCRERYINFTPKCLSDQDSWTLFQRTAMPIRDAFELHNDDKKMEEMGRQMIKHCRGLPLAITVLGGLLTDKNYTLHYWKRVSKDVGSHLLDDNNDSVNRVLSLSYEELPIHLKYCFLYLAHFPEDYEINVEVLSYFWATEGILRYTNRETIRDVGDSYIEELTRRNMVIAERDDTTSRFETCRLHDVMRDLCLSKAKEENFLQIIGIPSPTEHFQSRSTSRRFVAQNPTTLDIEREINSSKARSLVVVRRRYWNLTSISFIRLQVLRVLHLSHAKFEGEKLPYSIGKLIHLRYLNLEGADISHLPSSLRNLKLLIYLNLLLPNDSIFVPNVFMEMKELRYLALPEDMSKNTKLDLSHLVNLETLLNFSIQNISLEDLHGMPRLRILEIDTRYDINLETLSASIGGWRHLENLYIRYWGARKTKEWIQQLEEDPMPILEKLGQLKELYIRSNSFCGRRMVCSRGGFPQLQKLEFGGLDEWEEWIVEEGSMPLLHTLSIYGCEKLEKWIVEEGSMPLLHTLDIWNFHKLKEFPEGLRFITSLKNLRCGNMGEEWKARLSEGGEDYYKVQHIPSVGFYRASDMLQKFMEEHWHKLHSIE